MADLLPRIGFIDETSLKTNIAKTTGWAPKSARLVDHAHDRLDAPVRHRARTVYGWLPRGKGFSVDAGMISVAAMYTASGLQHVDCAP
jgi:hypothetical protein